MGNLFDKTEENHPQEQADESIKQGENQSALHLKDNIFGDNIKHGSKSNDDNQIDNKMILEDRGHERGWDDEREYYEDDDDEDNDEDENDVDTDTILKKMGIDNAKLIGKNSEISVRNKFIEAENITGDTIIHISPLNNDADEDTSKIYCKIMETLNKNSNCGYNRSKNSGTGNIGTGNIGTGNIGIDNIGTGNIGIDNIGKGNYNKHNRSKVMALNSTENNDISDINFIKSLNLDDDDGLNNNKYFRNNFVKSKYDINNYSTNKNNIMYGAGKYKKKKKSRSSSDESATDSRSVSNISNISDSNKTSDSRSKSDNTSRSKSDSRGNSYSDSDSDKVNRKKSKTDKKLNKNESKKGKKKDKFEKEKIVPKEDQENKSDNDKTIKKIKNATKTDVIDLSSSSENSSIKSDSVFSTASNNANDGNVQSKKKFTRKINKKIQDKKDRVYKDSNQNKKDKKKPKVSKKKNKDRVQDNKMENLTIFDNLFAGENLEELDPLHDSNKLSNSNRNENIHYEYSQSDNNNVRLLNTIEMT